MRLTIDQVGQLAGLEQKHPQRLVRMDPDQKRTEDLYNQCITGTVAYCCEGCGVVFSIEPDGTIETWSWSSDDA